MRVLSRMIAPLVVIGAGLVTFVIVFLMLQLGPAAQDAPRAEPSPTVAPGARVGESVATGVAASHVVVGVPTAGWEQLLRNVRPGDRLNVMASLATASDGRPVTAVVVSGANVLQPASQQTPMLLGVEPDDAVVLAHVVLAGAPLAYVVWPPDGSPPPVVAPLDEQDTRARFGLTPRPLPQGLPTATPAPAAAPPTRAAEATSVREPTRGPELAAASEPTARPLPDRYVVKPGDTLQSIADDLGIDVGALWWANRHLSNPSYVMAGMELAVPRFRGFLYQVQPGDSWFALSRRFGLTPEYLRERNELPDDAPLNAGMFIFVPLSP